MYIKGAVFDMDGTLVDSLFLWEVIWKAFGEKYLNGAVFEPSAADDKAVRTLTLRAAMELLHQHYALGESGEELYTYVNELMKNFYANEVQLKNGAKELLAGLRQKGVKMCVASATALELIEIAVKHCGIDGYFDEIVSCATLGKGKEHPDVFLLAQEKLGTTTKETWVFEDSLVALETAQKIGMPTVGVFDRCNPYGEALKAVSTIYVGEGGSLAEVLSY